MSTLTLLGCFLEVHEHARTTRLTEHVRLQLGGEAIVGQIVLASQKGDVFPLWIHEEIAVFGAYGAVAVANVGLGERRQSCLQSNLAAMAAAGVCLKI
jgi:hypothetical protein